MNVASSPITEQRAPAQDSIERSPAIDRNQFSEDALTILDHYNVNNATDPLAILVGAIDRMTANQREVISRFETAIALAGIEFGRIDLAIQKAEEIQRSVESLVTATGRMQSDFAVTTDKIRQRSNSDILLNHLKPFIYGLFGALLTLLVLFAVSRFKSS
jgi:ribosomal protein L17